MDSRPPPGRSTVVLFALGLLLGLGLLWAVSRLGWGGLGERLSTFTTIFLGIFIEAAPFLLLGTLASGLLEEFVSPQALRRWIPPGRVSGVLAGAGLGFLFPVCECGTVPVARRLLRKGLPLPVAVSFLLAAPVVNPIVLFSTAAAFGFGPMLALRFGLTLLIAALSGVLFSFAGAPARLLRPAAWPPIQGGLEPAPAHSKPVAPGASTLSPGTPFARASRAAHLNRALTIAADEFTEMGRYLVLGAALAALLQSTVPQAGLLAVGSGPLLSVGVMLGLAFILSICSTVDSFVALAFLGTFTPGSVLAFLVYGPMVDLKSTLLYLTVFRRRSVGYLVALPLVLTFLAALVINRYLSL